jgi:hypothetical protein
MYVSMYQDVVLDYFFTYNFDFKNDCEFTNIFSKFANEQI